MVLSPDIHGTKSNTLNFLSTELFKVNVKKEEKEDFSKLNLKHIYFASFRYNLSSVLQHCIMHCYCHDKRWLEKSIREIKLVLILILMTLICRETTLSSVIDAAMNTSVLGTTRLSSEQCHMQMLLQISHRNCIKRARE